MAGWIAKPLILIIFFTFSTGTASADLGTRLAEEMTGPRPSVSPRVQELIQSRHIVWVNGILGEFSINGKFRHNIEALKNDFGATSVSALFPPTAKPPLENAEDLALRLPSAFRRGGYKPLVVVAHSRGGLEALLAVLRNPSLMESGMIETLVLVQAPLNGTPLADLGLGLPGLPKATLEALRPGVSRQEIDKLLGGMSEELRERISSRVYYVRSSEPSDTTRVSLKHATKYIASKAGANDGLVPLSSQLIDGFGTELGAPLTFDHGDLFEPNASIRSGVEFKHALTRALFLELAEVALGAEPIVPAVREWMVDPDHRMALARELEAVARSKYSELAAARKLAQGDPQLISQLEAAISQFQEAYDRYALAAMDALIDSHFYYAEAALEEVRKRVAPGDLERLDRRILELTKFRADYLKSRRHPEGRDVGRVRFKVDNDAFQGFYKVLGVLGPELSRILEAGSSKEAKTVRTQRFLKIVRGLPKLLSGVLRTMGALLWKSQTRATGTPLLDSANELMTDYGSALGYEVVVSGRENVPPSPTPYEKRVQVFLANHQNVDLDAIVLGNLKLDQSAIFFRPEGLPQPLIDQLKKSDHVLVLGPGSDAEKLTIEAFEIKGIRRLIVYPEGNAKATVMDTRPIPVLFLRLLSKLRKQGYELEIFPVSMPDNYRPLALNSAPLGGEPSVLRAFIHPRISSQEVAGYLDSDSPERLLERVRQLWIDDRSYGSRLDAMPAFDGLYTMMNDFLFGPKSEICAGKLEGLSVESPQ